ncbi:MAG: hypothetical protein R2856_23285 [Caldilineaceae bacterium]
MMVPSTCRGLRSKDAYAQVAQMLKPPPAPQSPQAPSVPPDHDLACCDPAAHVCPQCNLFGSPLLEGTLWFGDACLAPGWDIAARAATAADNVGDVPLREHERSALQRRSQVEIRHGVRIHRRRGVAVDEMLFATEAGQSGLRFAGCIEGTVAGRGRIFSLDDVVYPQDLAWLVAALNAVRQLGGRKSRGWATAKSPLMAYRYTMPTTIHTPAPASLLRNLRGGAGTTPIAGEPKPRRTGLRLR